MRIQLASDLHLEFLAEPFPGERLIAPVDGADVLVLAGDIANGDAAIRAFADWPVPVIYVAGNHESYGLDLDTSLEAMRAAAEGTAVRFLENDRVDLDGVRFLGCTLWTDYRLDPGSGSDVAAAMRVASRWMVDHRLIHHGDAPFTPTDARAIHDASRLWLLDALATPHAGPTVVVTHHGVHPGSVHPRFAGSDVNPAFVSDLGRTVLERADLWLHGHIHDSVDYRVGTTRVVTNPRGYASNRLAIDRIADLAAENPLWDATRTIDLGR